MTAKELYDAARSAHLAAVRTLAEAQDTGSQRLLVKLEHKVADALAERRRAFASYMESDEA